MNLNIFENKIDEIVDELNIEIDDELIYDSSLTSCIFYISSFLKNSLIKNDEIEIINNEIDKTIDKFVKLLHKELNDVEFNVYIVNDEIEIDLIDDEFEYENIDELYDDMKIFF